MLKYLMMFMVVKIVLLLCYCDKIVLLDNMRKSWSVLIIPICREWEMWGMR